MSRVPLLFLVLAGCASARAPESSAPIASQALEAWRASPARPSPADGLARVTPSASPSSVSPAPRRTGGRPTFASRRRVDVDLVRAPLADALRLLAGAAGRDLVVEPSLTRPVSVSLRHVDPLSAMQVLSEANDVEVLEVRGVLLARPRRALSSPASPE